MQFIGSVISGRTIIDSVPEDANLAKSFMRQFFENNERVYIAFDTKAGTAMLVKPGYMTLLGAARQVNPDAQVEFCEVGVQQENGLTPVRLRCTGMMMIGFFTKSDNLIHLTREEVKKQCVSVGKQVLQYVDGCAVLKGTP